MKDTHIVDFSEFTYDSDLSFVPIRENKLMYFLAVSTFFVTFLIGPLIVMGFLNEKLRNRKREVYKNFADKHKWDYLLEDEKKEAPMSIRGLEETKTGTIQHSIKGKFMGSIFNYYEYKYSGFDIGLSRKDAKKRSITVMELDLKKNLPYILLDSRGNERLSTQVRDGAHKISLESDFDRYFQLYAEYYDRVDVLSIISPDVMSTLIQFNHRFDIEIISNKAYIFMEGEAIYGDAMKELFIATDALLYEIGHRSRTFREEQGKNYAQYIENQDYQKKIRTFSNLPRFWQLVIMFYLLFIPGYMVFKALIWIFDNA